MHLIVLDLKHYYSMIFIISLFKTTVPGPVISPQVFHSQSEIWTLVYLVPHSFINNGCSWGVPILRNAVAQIRDTSNFRGCHGTNSEIIRLWAHKSKRSMCLYALEKCCKKDSIKQGNLGFVCLSESSKKR